MTAQAARTVNAFITPNPTPCSVQFGHYRNTSCSQFPPSSFTTSSSTLALRHKHPTWRHLSYNDEGKPPLSRRHRTATTTTITAQIRFMGTPSTRDCENYLQTASHTVTLIGDEYEGLSLSALTNIEATLKHMYGGYVSHWKDLSDHVMQGVIQNVKCDSASSSTKALSTLLTQRILTECADVSERDVPNVVVQDAAQVRTRKKLAVFDMDSTLIQNETIDEIASLLDLHDAVKRITDLAMNGQLDFAESLEQRVALLQGLPAIRLDEIKDKVRLTAGAQKLVTVLQRKYGCKTAVISGGFDFLANHMQQVLGLDHAFANQLAVDPNSGTLTGVTRGAVVDAQFKARKLDELASQTYSIGDRNAVMAVGDGANDIPMLTKAGLGIAFNAKPRVQEAVNVKLTGGASLDQVLYLLGLDDTEIEEFCK